MQNKIVFKCKLKLTLLNLRLLSPIVYTALKLCSHLRGLYFIVLGIRFFHKKDFFTGKKTVFRDMWIIFYEVFILVFSSTYINFLACTFIVLRMEHESDSENCSPSFQWKQRLQEVLETKSERMHALREAREKKSQIISSIEKLKSKRQRQSKQYDSQLSALTKQLGTARKKAQKWSERRAELEGKKEALSENYNSLYQKALNVQDRETEATEKEKQREEEIARRTDEIEQNHEILLSQLNELTLAKEKTHESLHQTVAEIQSSLSELTQETASDTNTDKENSHLNDVIVSLTHPIFYAEPLTFETQDDLSALHKKVEHCTENLHKAFAHSLESHQEANTACHECIQKIHSVDHEMKLAKAEIIELENRAIAFTRSCQ